MKWVVATLVLLNLTLWMWASWHEPPASGPRGPVPRSEVAAGTLRLLSEPGVSVRARSPRKRPPVKALKDVAPPKRCFTLGPFTARKPWEKTRTRLTNRGLPAAAREEEETKITYRVYIPPLKSREAAAVMRKKLTRLGFRDHAILDEPGLRNAVSVGVFAVKANAMRRQRQLKKKKIKTRRQTLRRSRSLYWLDVKSENDLIEQLAGRKWGDPEAVLKQVDCPSAPLKTAGKERRKAKKSR